MQSTWSLSEAIRNLERILKHKQMFGVTDSLLITMLEESKTLLKDFLDEYWETERGN